MKEAFEKLQRPNQWQQLGLVSFLLVVGVVGRLIAYNYGLWNVTPLVAVTLFGACFLESRRLAALLPLAVLVASNTVIGGYQSVGMMCAVYAASITPVFLGGYLRQRLGPGRVFVSALASSIVFFLVTNFAHWIFLRPNTLPELEQCFVVAVPFFRLSLIGDLAWSAVLFGSYAFASQWGGVPRRLLRIPVSRD